MNEFSVKERYEERLNRLWDDARYSSLPFRERGYAAPAEVKVNALMFIGLNPSYKGDGTDERHFYSGNGKLHRYFHKFIDVSEATGLPWTHLDLFYVRETNQKNMEGLCEDAVGREFAREQFAITKDIMEQAKPCMLVVNNVYAKRWMKDKAFNPDAFDFCFDEEIGTYRIVNDSSLEGTPVFFSSMLTGQRALDLGSLERLEWHIRFVRKKTEQCG